MKNGGRAKRCCASSAITARDNCVTYITPAESFPWLYDHLHSLGLILGGCKNRHRVVPAASLACNSLYTCRYGSRLDSFHKTSLHTHGKKVLDSCTHYEFNVFHCSVCAYLLGAAESRLRTRFCPLCHVSVLGCPCLTFPPSKRKNHTCENHRHRDRISWCHLYLQQRLF